MMVENDSMKGVLFALGVVLIWSGSFVLARGLSTSIPQMTLSFWRWTIAVIAIAPFATKGAWVSRMMIKQNIRYLLLASFLGIADFNMLIYIAGQTTTSFNLSLISLTSPIFTLLISILYFKEKLKSLNLIGISIVILGVLTLVSKGNLQSLSKLIFSKGDLYMLMAALIFAVYAILIRMKPSSIDTKTFLFTTFIFGELMLLPAYIWEHKTLHFNIHFDRDIGLALIYLSVFASVVAYFYGMKP